MPLQMLQIDQYQNTLKNLKFKNHLFKGNKPRYILFVAYHLNQNYKPSNKLKLGYINLEIFY